MAIHRQNQTGSCPVCGTPGPYNFKVEIYITVKPKEHGVHEETGQLRVVVCRKCNYELGSPLPTAPRKTK